MQAAFKNYEAFVVKELMSNFVSGYGPENYEFPTNGIISSQFLDSDILKAALKDFQKGESIQNKQYSFGTTDLIKDTYRNGTIFNITGVVGSALITINRNTTAEGIEVKIFNVTSLTSGSLGKELFFWDKEKYYPKSYVRNTENAIVVPYGNISQTYSLKLTINQINNITGN
jgi:hypothetical protein